MSGILFRSSSVIFVGLWTIGGLPDPDQKPFSPLSGVKWRASAERYEFFSSNLYLADFLTFQLRPVYTDEIFLHEKYVKEGLSISQIAALSFSSKPTVRKYLTKFGIPLRTPHNGHGRYAQTRFGQKEVKGKVIEHLAEQRVVSAIEELHAKGWSLRTICRFLTSMKVPTKCRGKAWHPEMVKRIISTKAPNRPMLLQSQMARER